jgi:hypothetical protein
LSYGRALDGSYEFRVLSVELGGEQWALGAKNIRNLVARKLITHYSELAVCSRQRLYRSLGRRVKGLKAAIANVFARVMGAEARGEDFSPKALLFPLAISLAPRSGPLARFRDEPT